LNPVQNDASFEWGKSSLENPQYVLSKLLDELNVKSDESSELELGIHHFYKADCLNKFGLFNTISNGTRDITSSGVLTEQVIKLISNR
jgi:hypothetical protein